MRKIKITISCFLFIILQGCVGNDDATGTTTTTTTTGTTTTTTTTNPAGDGISISEASDIIVDVDNINLDKGFSVLVVNSGSPVPGVTVSLTLTPEDFAKGAYVVTTTASGDVYAQTRFFSCAGEVVGNDLNGNGNIDPSGFAAITAHPTLTPTITDNSAVVKTVVTNDDGQAYFSLRYPRAVAEWATFTITATAIVDGGTITTPLRDYELQQLASELTDTASGFAGDQSPFGINAGSANNCADLN